MKFKVDSSFERRGYNKFSFFILQSDQQNKKMKEERNTNCCGLHGWWCILNSIYRTVSALAITLEVFFLCVPLLSSFSIVSLLLQWMFNIHAHSGNHQQSANTQMRSHSD